MIIPVQNMQQMQAKSEFQRVLYLNTILTKTPLFSWCVTGELRKNYASFLYKPARHVSQLCILVV